MTKIDKDDTIALMEKIEDVTVGHDLRASIIALIATLAADIVELFSHCDRAGIREQCRLACEHLREGVEVQMDDQGIPKAPNLKVVPKDVN